MLHPQDRTGEETRAGKQAPKQKITSDITTSIYNIQYHETSLPILQQFLPKSTLLMDNLPNSTRRSCDIDVLESFNIAVWLTCMTNNFIQPSSNPSYLIAFFEVQIPTSTRLVL